MKRPLRMCGVWLSAMACIPWLFPTRVSAADGAVAPQGARTIPPIIRDIALGPQGTMAGQLVDTQGRGIASKSVIVKRPGLKPQATQTDQNGRFQIRGLSGGMYQVAAADSAAICRCWTDKTAPPSSREQLLLVSGKGVQRGQYPFGEMLFSAPVLIALVIAAAVAIPIAVHNSQDDAS